MTTVAPFSTSASILERFALAPQMLVVIIAPPHDLVHRAQSPQWSSPSNALNAPATNAPSGDETWNLRPC